MDIENLEKIINISVKELINFILNQPSGSSLNLNIKKPDFNVTLKNNNGKLEIIKNE